MKKSLLLVMLAMVVSIGNGYAQTYVPIMKIEGVDPPLTARTIDAATPNSICWQVVYDQGRNTLRPQIFPANGATAEGITEEMVKSLETIRPEITSAGKWKSFGFTCKPAGWKKFIDYSNQFKERSSAPISTTAKTVALALPRTEQPAETVVRAPLKEPTLTETAPQKLELTINVVKAKPAPATEPAALKEELANLKNQLNALVLSVAKPVTPRASKTAVKRRQPAISPLAACQANLRNLENGKAAADKSLGECQAGLKTANNDLETAKKANAEEVAKAEKKCTGTVVKLQEDLKKAYDNVGYSPWIVALLALLAFLAGIVAAIFVKKLATAGKTPPATPARSSKAP
ncbi:MAG: hypothetical protein Q8O59_04590 [bacterium]|nr:hypothetical protein [bacterium]